MNALLKKYETTTGLLNRETSTVLQYKPDPRDKCQAFWSHAEQIDKYRSVPQATKGVTGSERVRHQLEQLTVSFLIYFRIDYILRERFERENSSRLVAHFKSRS